MPELRAAALISDMDGVLIDTGGIYDRHWERWAAHHGVSHERIAAVHLAVRPWDHPPRGAGADAVAEARRFNDALADDPDAVSVTAMPGAVS
jgi:beta-phosphoglucomutase-like phosphatase (HAD superfamily)